MTTLTVNQNNALKLLADAFSARTTFVTELMQNARRAGATEIKFWYTDNTLTVVDDGCGVADFSKLLTLCESGWSQDVQESDAPYGVGFLSAIMASSEFTVTSNGKTLHAVTGELLAGVPASIVDDPDGPQIGTKIELQLRNTLDLRRTLEISARTFPIQVYRSGIQMSRNLALDGATHSIEIPGLGTLVWSGFIGSNASLGGYSYALQGLPIKFGKDVNSYDGGYYRDWVVHLDQTKFRGRMPDREAVIWQPEYEGLTKQVDAAQREILRRHWLNNCKEPSLDLYRLAANELGRSALDAVEVIPAGVFHKLSSAPECALLEGERLEWRGVAEITRENMHELTYMDNFPDVDDGDNIAALRALCDSEIAERKYMVPGWVMCRRVDYDTVNAEYGTYDGRNDEFTVAATPIPTVDVNLGRYFTQTVQPCEAVRVTLTDENDNVVASTVETYFTPTVDGVLYLTGDAKSVSSYVFQQNTDFVREDSDYEWDWDRINGLCDRFTVEYKLACGKDPIVLVENALEPLKNRLSLGGKAYAVMFVDGVSLPPTVVPLAKDSGEALLLKAKQELRYLHAYRFDLPDLVSARLTAFMRELDMDV